MATETKIQWTDSTRARFAKHFTEGLPDECWPWNGAMLDNGYGAFAKPGGGTTTAHRRNAEFWRNYRLRKAVANG